MNVLKKITNVYAQWEKCVSIVGGFSKFQRNSLIQNYLRKNLWWAMENIALQCIEKVSKLHAKMYPEAYLKPNWNRNHQSSPWNEKCNLEYKFHFLTIFSFLAIATNFFLKQFLADQWSCGQFWLQKRVC